MSKAQAFDVLACAFNIESEPISNARQAIFHLVHDLAVYAFEAGGQDKLRLVVQPESLDLLGCLYQGLHELEHEAMRDTHAANLRAYFDEARAEDAEKGAQQAAGQEGGQP